jgi:hypothetical protein
LVIPMTTNEAKKAVHGLSVNVATVIFMGDDELAEDFLGQADAPYLEVVEKEWGRKGNIWGMVMRELDNVTWREVAEAYHRYFNTLGRLPKYARK